MSYLYIPVWLFFLAVIYLGVTMALGTMSVCLSVLVLHFHHKGSTIRMPHWTRIIFIHYGSKMCGFQSLGLQFPSERLKERRCLYNDVTIRRRKTCNSTSPDRRVAELQNILSGTSNDSNSPMLDREQQNTFHRNHPPTAMTTDNFLLKDTLNYHNIDINNLDLLDDADQRLFSTAHQHEVFRKEWQLMAKVLDRFFFVTVFTIMTITACLILLSPWYITTISENLKIAKAAAAREKESNGSI